MVRRVRLVVARVCVILYRNGVKPGVVVVVCIFYHVGSFGGFA